MKKFSLFFTFIIASLLCHAQWQINGSNVYYDQGNVGIGLSNPEHRLEVSGIEDYANENRTFFRLFNHSISPNSIVSMKLSAGESGSCTRLSHTSDTYTASFNMRDYGSLHSNGAGLMIRASGGIIRLETSATGLAVERMRIDTSGYIGIGTEEPKSKLHIADGDIYLSDISRGIIMKSPDGSCWKGTVDNIGNLNFIQIVCPELTTETIYQSESISDIIVYPNPTSTSIYFKFGGTYDKGISCTIMDMNGRQIIDKKNISTSDKIDLSAFPAGIYMVYIQDSKGKLIKIGQYPIKCVSGIYL